MKNIITILVVLVLIFNYTTSSAQNNQVNNDKKFWPMSTNSAEARESFTQALDYLWNARHEEYKGKLEQALNEDPVFFLAYANAAIFKYINEQNKSNEMGRSSEVAKSREKGELSNKLDKALGLPQDKLTAPEKIMREVLVNIKENNTNKFRENIDQMVNQHPDIIQSYEFAKAMSRFILNDPELAHKYVQTTVEKFPNHGPAWNDLGYYHMEKGNMDKAEEAFNQYLKVSPNEANAHDSYGEFCMKKGKYDEARMHYEKAVEMGMTASRENAEKAREMAQGADVE